MDFLHGVAVNLGAEITSRTFRSLIRSEDKTVKTMDYEESLANSICLARAITVNLSKANTTKNMYLKKWYSDLIVAADEGEKTLQSSPSDTTALKSALSKLEKLTSTANTYLKLFEWEKEAAASASASASVDLYKSGNKEALNSPAAARNPETSPLIALRRRPASDNSSPSTFSPTVRKISRGELAEIFAYFDQDNDFTVDLKPLNMILARPDSQLKQLCPVRKISKTTTGRISKTHQRLFRDMKALTCMGLYPEGTGFPSDAIEDSLCKELPKNLYDSTNTGLLYNGEHSINNRMKMKGKCQECEFDEQTGYGETSMPTWCCFPSNSCGVASNHLSPSFDDIPEENDGCLSQAGTFGEQTGYGDASTPTMSCFPSSSYGGATNYISPSCDDIPEEDNGRAADVSEIF